MARFSNLLSPLTIGKLTIRNRLMQTAHAQHFAVDGVLSARDRAYYEERARGGIGLFVIANQIVHPTGGPGRRGIGYTFLPEGEEPMRRVVEAVHRHGARIFVQINHFGPSVTSDPDDYRVLWAPSRTVSAVSGEQSKEMEPEEIAEVVWAFAEAAATIRDAGADGVEIHMAHGYLLNSFLSPLTNCRLDRYGGSLENRMRLSREVIDAVRARVGEDFVVGVRLTLSDEQPGGLTIDDSIEIAQHLAADGAIDFISTSAGGGTMFWVAAQTGFAPDGYLLDKIARLKAAVPAIPVFAVGGINDPNQAEAVIAGGQADMVAITRGQIADPELPRKIAEGREDEIRHCIRGNQGCLSRIARGMPMTCTVNPAAGRESVFGAATLKLAESPGRWLVIGGGPSGMKAAEGLAERGHAVTLVERAPELGGQVNLITRLPGRGTWANIRGDLERSIARLGVEMRCGTEFTADDVVGFGADGVIVATGAEADRTGSSTVSPPPAGLESATVLSLWDAIRAPERAGRRAVLLDDEGAFQIGGAAHLMLAQGTEVVLVSRLPMLLPGCVYTLDLPPMYRNLLGMGLEQRLNSWARRIEGRSVVVANLYSGQEEVLRDVDSIVLGTARHPSDALYHALKGRVPNLHRVGDCVAPRTMDHAIYEGFLAGRELFDWTTRPFFEEARDPASPIRLPDFID